MLYIYSHHLHIIGAFFNSGQSCCAVEVGASTYYLKKLVLYIQRYQEFYELPYLFLGMIYLLQNLISHHRESMSIKISMTILLLSLLKLQR
jgi:hypothetical protein